MAASRGSRRLFPLRLSFLSSCFLLSSLSLFALFACQLLPPSPLLPAPPLFQTLLPLLLIALILGSPSFLFAPRGGEKRERCSGKSAPPKSDATGPVPRSESHEAAVQPATDQGGGGLLKTREPTLSRLHAAFLLVGLAGRRRADILCRCRENKTHFFFFLLDFEKKKKKTDGRPKTNQGEKKYKKYKK